ncbi:hypothetical protein RSOLAG22IIIB_13304 [Rhizoctonia solani]|uniref:Uncharacterized protein n=1 Tax=Rhizoctonia solani TaxID=456999 RepID=A0A0K6FLS5_9AGAM|nr:hypothetical protein RSOLAG22IIIB_13304 [Rhizoctonia solani]
MLCVIRRELLFEWVRPPQIYQRWFSIAKSIAPTSGTLSKSLGNWCADWALSRFGTGRKKKQPKIWNHLDSYPLATPWAPLAPSNFPAPQTLRFIVHKFSMNEDVYRSEADVSTKPVLGLKTKCVNCAVTVAVTDGHPNSNHLTSPPTMTEVSPSNPSIAGVLQRCFQSLPPLKELSADLDRRRRRLEEMKRQSAEDFEKMKEDSAWLDKELMDFRNQMGYGERTNFYRMLNSMIREANSPVYPIPLPNGGYPAEGTFPETLGDFLSLDVHALAFLLELYELPHEDQLNDARQALARHCHISVVST